MNRNIQAGERGDGSGSEGRFTGQRVAEAINELAGGIMVWESGSLSSSWPC